MSYKVPGISLNPAAIARNKKKKFDSHQISDTVAGWRQALNIHFVIWILKFWEEDSQIS